jgi:acyl-CoA hydrolase
MDIEVLVEAADVIAGTQRLAASGIFTMVAVDAGGQTIPVPTFTPETEVDWEKYRQAETRRAARKQS